MKQRGNGGREAQIRQHIATEAARIMVEDGIRDFATAKRKAVHRLNLGHTRQLPTNREIEDALFTYQRLFRADRQPQRLRELREAAAKAMRMLEAFDPRLVGPVLSGSAGEHSPVTLHLFADTPEEVDLFLSHRNIPHDQGERQLRMDQDHTRRFPLYRFVAGDVPLELTVFRPHERQSPFSPVDGKPMQRAGLAAVEELLEEEPETAQTLSFGG